MWMSEAGEESEGGVHGAENDNGRRARLLSIGIRALGYGGGGSGG